MQISRKAILTGVASSYAATGLPRFAAGAAEFTMKWGGELPLTHYVTIRMKEAADKVAQESGGRLEIKPFPNYQLGNDSSMLTQVRVGALELFLVGNAQIEPLVSAAGLSRIPFAFDSFRRGMAADDGPVGNHIRRAIRKANFYVFDKAWSVGFAQLSNAVHPITKPDDLRGLKLYVPPTPVNIAALKAFGASPIPIEGPQVYLAIQNHLLDGTQNTLASVEGNRYYEVLKFATLLNISWTSLVNIGNVDAMEKLPKNLRELLEKRIDEAAILAANDIQNGEEALIATLKRRGMTFNQPDLGPFKAVIRSAGLYEKWRDQYGADAWSALERSSGQLA